MKGGSDTGCSIACQYELYMDDLYCERGKIPRSWLVWIDYHQENGGWREWRFYAFAARWREMENDGIA